MTEMVNLAVLGPKRCIKWKRVGLGFVGDEVRANRSRVGDKVRCE
jgi:hypothetical protein